MPALCSILNSAYYANNYAGIFDVGLMAMLNSKQGCVLISQNFGCLTVIIIHQDVYACLYLYLWYISTVTVLV